MKLDLPDEEVKLLITALEDLIISLLSEAPNVKKSDSKIYKQYAINLGLLKNKIEKQIKISKDK